MVQSHCVNLREPTVYYECEYLLQCFQLLSFHNNVYQIYFTKIFCFPRLIFTSMYCILIKFETLRIRICFVSNAICMFVYKQNRVLLLFFFIIITIFIDRSLSLPIAIYTHTHSLDLLSFISSVLVKIVTPVRKLRCDGCYAPF